jgi:hypothetical protein
VAAIVLDHEQPNEERRPAFQITPEAVSYPFIYSGHASPQQALHIEAR